MTPVRSQSAISPYPNAEILAVVPWENASCLRDTVCPCHPEWTIEEVGTCREALERLKLMSGNYSVVICDRDLPDGCWRDILAAIQSVAMPPNLIVTSRLADERLWAEVLILGGYDVLPQPLERREAIRVIGLAHEHWAEAAKQIQIPFCAVLSS